MMHLAWYNFIRDGFIGVSSTCLLCFVANVNLKSINGKILHLMDKNVAIL